MSLAIFNLVLVALTSVDAYWFRRVTPTPSLTTPAQLNGPCYYVPEPGRCKALKPMYYFDFTDNTCKRFNYGGCGGNDNRFETEDLCKYVCQRHNCFTSGCLKKACTTQTCPNHPGAICFAVCECRSVWVLDGEDVSDTCNSS